MVTSLILSMLLLLWGFTFAVRGSVPEPRRVRAPRLLRAPRDRSV